MIYVTWLNFTITNRNNCLVLLVKGNSLRSCLNRPDGGAPPSGAWSRHLHSEDEITPVPRWRRRFMPSKAEGGVYLYDVYGRFSIPSTRTTDSMTCKYVLGKSVLQAQTCEHASTYLQLEQQRTRWRHHLCSSVNCATASFRHILLNNINKWYKTKSQPLSFSNSM